MRHFDTGYFKKKITKRKFISKKEILQIALSHGGQTKNTMMEKELMDMVDISTMEDGRNFCQKSSKDTN